jgi:hypothetical protein
MSPLAFALWKNKPDVAFDSISICVNVAGGGVIHAGARAFPSMRRPARHFPFVASRGKQIYVAASAHRWRTVARAMLVV